MIRLLLLSAILLTALTARENPFFPSVGEKDIPYTSNEDRSIPPLKSATIKLPPQARVLKKVTLEYKNLDGSLESTSIELDNFVDWHLPIYLSQSDSSTPTPAKINRYEESKVKGEFHRIASIKYLTFFASGKKLKLITNDKKKRDFLLVNPHRIVIDFEKEKFIKSYIKHIPDNIFKKIRIGYHKGYYRAVIELDGHYRYKIEQISNGYMIELR